MKGVMQFIISYFNLNVLVLCIIASFFLVYIDGEEYKKEGLKREYKFSIITAFFYIIGGCVIYISTLFIRI